MIDCQNLQKLSQEALDLIAYSFKNFMVGWTLCYMVEIRLDDPVHHILSGGPGLKTHGGNGSRHYANHYGDDDWAIIHVDDASWQALPHDEMAERATKVLVTAEAHEIAHEIMRRQILFRKF